MTPEQSYSMDCVKLSNDINRYIHEIQESNSAHISGTNEFDATRIKTYLSALRQFHDFVQSQPLIDQPETSPAVIPMRPNTEIQVLENESLNYLVGLLVACRDELMNSVSNRTGTKLNKFDSARFIAFIDKMEKYMADYVEIIDPLDLPDSSPRTQIVDDGLKGT